MHIFKIKGCRLADTPLTVSMCRYTMLLACYVTLFDSFSSVGLYYFCLHEVICMMPVVAKLVLVFMLLAGLFAYTYIQAIFVPEPVMTFCHCF